MTFFKQICKINNEVVQQIKKKKKKFPSAYNVVIFSGVHWFEVRGMVDSSCLWEKYLKIIAVLLSWIHKPVNTKIDGILHGRFFRKYKCKFFLSMKSKVAANAGHSFNLLQNLLLWCQLEFKNGNQYKTNLT